MMQNIVKQLSDARLALEKFAKDEQSLHQIKAAGDLIFEAVINGKKVISCGNGGSMCDAVHFAEEMTGKFRENRPPLPAIAISDPAYLSCTANDFGYDHSFSRFIEGIGTEGDILLAISTSGNSKNVIKGAEKAKKKKMHVIGLTGKDGGKLAKLCDIEIRAPYSDYADRAQEIHIKVIHILIDYVERKLTH